MFRYAQCVDMMNRVCSMYSVCSTCGLYDTGRMVSMSNECSMDSMDSMYKMYSMNDMGSNHSLNIMCK